MSDGYWIPVDSRFLPEGATYGTPWQLKFALLPTKTVDKGWVWLKVVAHRYIHVAPRFGFDIIEQHASVSKK